VATNVRDMLIELLPTGEAGQETVARRLNRSLSTLQRQLQAEGLSYRRWTGNSLGRLERRLKPVDQPHHKPEHQAGRRTTDNADESVEIAHGAGAKNQN